MTIINGKVEKIQNSQMAIEIVVDGMRFFATASSNFFDSLSGLKEGEMVSLGAHFGTIVAIL